MIMDETNQYDVLKSDIRNLRNRCNELQKQIDNLCNSKEVLSAVADKLLERGILK